MKILHLTSQDNGGAGRAAIRLHQSLLYQGIKSQMLVQEKIGDYVGVQKVAQTRVEKFLIYLRIAYSQLPTIFYTHRKKDIFSPHMAWSNKKLIKKIKKINPDIVHIHWINNGFLNIKDLKKINKPIVWSLHDANPYTGGCHVIPSSCSKTKTFCHQCDFLHSCHKYDLSYLTFKIKQKVYKKLNLTVNGLSKWIAKCAKESTLFRNKTIVNLPNPIDTNTFQSIDKTIARKLLKLKLSNHKCILGFGAVSATSVPRKGYQELLQALKNLNNKEKYELVVFGSAQGEQLVGIKTHFIGILHDDISLALLYNSIDIFISSSLSENLSNVILESLACGTPVVAFNIGGNSDLIKHKQNGYLAENTNELSRGIEWVASKENYQQLSSNAKEYIQQYFNYHDVANKYIALYKEIICSKN